MSLRSFIIILLNCISYLGAVTNAERCIVIAPRAIRSNSDYCISIATVGATEPIKFRVKIYEREEETSNKTLDYEPNNKNLRHDPYDDISLFGPKMTTKTKRSIDSYSTDDKSDTPITLVRVTSVIVNPETPEVVKFKFDKDVLPGNYVLEVQSLSDSSSVFNEKKFLYVQSTSFSIFIQTSKAIYRPGDTIKYRILILDSETKPIAVEKKLTVSIFDGTGNKIYQLLEQSALRGVYLGEFKTSVEAELGVWEIEAQYNDKQIRKTVELAEYVLPKFQVSAKTPNYISKNSKHFSVKVLTRYTFGKPVCGTATIKATPVLNTLTPWLDLAQSLTITCDIHCERTVKFDVTDFELLDGQTYNSILIETTVEEKATKAIGRAPDKTITVDSTKSSCKFNIILTHSKFYLPNTQFSIKVQIKPEQGQHLHKKFVELRVVFDSKSFDNKKSSKHKLDEDANCEIWIDVPNGTKKSIKFRVQYQDAYEEVVVLSKDFHVEVINEKPKLNEAIKFQIGSIEKLNSVSFYIVGRGNVLVSKTIKLAGENIAVLEIDSTFSMTPLCSLVAFYIADNGSIVSDSTQIEFSPEVMPNPISITVSNDELQPKQKLCITVKTEKDSDIALTFTDQSLLLTKRGNDLSRTQINNELQKYDNAGDFDLDEAYTESYITLMEPGTLVLTDAVKFKVGMNASSTTTPVRGNVSVNYYPDIVQHIVIPLMPTCKHKLKRKLLNRKNTRLNFPEIVMWKDETSVNASTIFKTEMPDTVTSWMLNGLSLNSNRGLGIPRAPLILSTFKPFFVDVNLPSSVKLGEFVIIPVAVHNYLNRPSRVKVHIEGNFKLIKSCNKNKRNMVHVPADSVRSIRFKIKPKKIGKLLIKISATSCHACDRIIRSLMIKPSGIVIKQYETQTFIVNDTQTLSGTFNIDIPQRAIAGSVRVELAFQGDKYRLNLLNANNFFNKIDGNDHATKLITRTIKLSLLSDIKQLSCPTKETLNKAISKILINKEQYQCIDGGFNSALDCSDRNRGTWFTAQNAIGLVLNKELTTVDVTVLKETLDYLAGIQLPDGSFVELSTDKFSFLGDGIILTPHTLYPFVFADYYDIIKGQYSVLIEKGFKFLFDRLDTLDLFSLFVFAELLAVMKHSNKEIVFEILRKKAYRSRDSECFNIGEAKRIDMDIQAFGFYAMIFNNEPLESLLLSNTFVKKIVEWSDDRINTGFMASPKILDDFYNTFSLLNSNIDVVFTTRQTDSGQQVKINDENRFILQRFELPNNVTSIDVKGSGSGFGMVQLKYQYNLHACDVFEKFAVNLKVTAVGNLKWNLNICTNIKETDKPETSNAILEVSFPAGCHTSEFVQDVDASSSKIQMKRFRDNDLVVTFKNLTSNTECFDVLIVRNVFVTQPSMGSILIYDEETINARTEKSYEI